MSDWSRTINQNHTPEMPPEACTPRAEGSLKDTAIGSHVNGVANTRQNSRISVEVPRPTASTELSAIEFGSHSATSDGGFVVDAKRSGELVGGHPNHYAYRVGPTMPCGGPPIPSPDRLLAIDSSSCPDDETSSMARSVCRMQAREELESPDSTREESGGCEPEVDKPISPPWT